MLLFIAIVQPAIAQQTVPTVTISASPLEIEEGGIITVTIQSSQAAPAGGLAVNLNATLTGNFQVTGTGSIGDQTITIPANQVSTPVYFFVNNDQVDSANGSLVATLQTGDDYELGSTTSVSVTITDNDEPPPNATISAGHSQITEGENSYFDITLNSAAPTGGITLNYNFQETGDFLVAGISTGNRTVRINAGQTSARISFNTVNDNRDEENGRITLTLLTGTGYQLTADTSRSIVIADNDAPLSASIRAYSDTVHEGNSGLFYVAITERAPAGGITVNIRVTSEGSYTVNPLGDQTVTINEGLTSNVFAIAVQEDDQDVPDGLVSIQILTGTGYQLSANTVASSIIADNDLQPLATINSVSSPIVEGNPAEFLVSLSATAPSGGITVPIDIATSGQFGISPGQQSVQINQGQTTARLSLPTTSDNAREANGSVTATLASGTGYRLASQTSAQVIIHDAGVLASISRVSSPITEGDNAIFEVTLSQAATTGGQTIELQLQQSGDFIADNYLNRQSLFIAAGQTSARYMMPTQNDQTDEANGSVTATMLSGTGYFFTSASSTITIQDNDQLPIISVAAGPGPIGEGGTSYFYIDSNQPIAAGGLSVNVQISHAGQFSVSPTGSQTVTLTTGSSRQQLLISVAEDTIVQPADGSVSLQLLAGNGYQLSGTTSQTLVIQNNDQPPPPPPITASISRGTSQINEGGSSYFQVNLSQAAPVGGLIINLNLTATGDFGVSPTGTQTINISQGASSGRVTITSVDDNVDEVNGQISATIQAGAGYQLSSSITSSIAVVDNDQPPIASISSQTAAIDEGAQAIFTVTLSAPAGAAGITVNASVAALPAFEVQAASRQVVIPAGETSANFGVITLNDGIDEPDGTLTVTLTSGTGYQLGSSISQSIAVRDNDDQPASISFASVNRAAETITEGQSSSFTITLSLPAPAGGTTVNLQIDQQGNFGVTPTGQQAISFAEGETSATFQFTTSADQVAELQGSVTATILAGNNYRINPNANSHTTNILDTLPTFTVSAANDYLTEGVRGYFTVTSNIPAPSQGWLFTLNFSQQGDLGLIAEGDVTTFIAAGATSRQVNFLTSDDQTAEPTGRVTASLVARSHYQISASGSHSINILDNDVIPEVRVSSTTTSLVEGESASFTFTINRPAPVGGLTIQFNANENGDFTATPIGAQSITIPVGTTSASWSYTSVDDDRDEADGDITLTISPNAQYQVASASWRIVVQDNDLPLPSLAVTAMNNQVIEGQDIHIRLSLSRPAPINNFQVQLNIIENGNYAVTPSGSYSFNFSQGQSVRDIILRTTDDAQAEPDGAVTVRINSANHYSVSNAAGSAIVAILDNDAPNSQQSIPTISLSTQQTSSTSGDTLQFMVRSSRNAPAGGLSINLEISNTGRGQAEPNGRHQIIIPQGSLVALLNVDTSGILSNGNVSVTLLAGNHYNISSGSNSESVAVAVNPYQKHLASYLLNRADRILQNQPALSHYLRSQHQVKLFGEANDDLMFLKGRYSDPHWWTELNASWREDSASEANYLFLTAGSHFYLGDQLLAGTLAQVDFTDEEISDSDADITGFGWRTGLYIAAEHARHPLFVEGRVMFGQTYNEINYTAEQIARDGDFYTSQWLMQLKVEGDVYLNKSLTLTPYLDWRHLNETSNQFSDSQQRLFIEQNIRMSQTELGLDILWLLEDYDWLVNSGISTTSSSISSDFPELHGAFEKRYSSLEFGIRLPLSNGYIKIDTYYDGFGRSGFKNYGVKGNLRYNF